MARTTPGGEPETVPGLDPAVAAAIAARDHDGYERASARARARLDALLSVGASVVVGADVLMALATAAERAGAAVDAYVREARQAVETQRPEYVEARRLAEENARAMHDAERARAALVEVECPDCYALVMVRTGDRDAGAAMCAECDALIPAPGALADGAT